MNQSGSHLETTERGQAASKRKQPAITRRDPKRTREKIIACATQEFARNGYDGARIDQIVQSAGISKNLLYHHFAGKEELFIKVMEGAYALMRDHHRDFQIRDLGPLEGMRSLVRYTFEHFLKHPEVISLLNSENLHQARHIRKSESVKELYNPLLETMDELVRRGQEQGIFRRNVDPVDLYISLSGLGYFYLSNQYTLGTIFRQNLTEAERIRQREDHMVDMVIGYLCHKPEE